MVSKVVGKQIDFDKSCGGQIKIFQTIKKRFPAFPCLAGRPAQSKLILFDMLGR